MKPKVYVETSVISYLAARPSRDVIIAGRQAATHDWWENHRDRFEVYISALVEQEIAGGNAQEAARRCAIAEELVSVAVHEDAISIAEELLSSGAVPAGSEDDALHIGIAANQGSDYLLTWNFKHIHNARQIGKISMAVSDRGFSCPTICTPEELGG